MRQTPVFLLLQGDSGGPLFVNVNGLYIQMGIISSGIGCARTGVLGLYTRLSSFAPWILKGMRRAMGEDVEAEELSIFELMQRHERQSFRRNPFLPAHPEDEPVFVPIEGVEKEEEFAKNEVQELQKLSWEQHKFQELVNNLHHTNQESLKFDSHWTYYNIEYHDEVAKINVYLVEDLHYFSLSFHYNSVQLQSRKVSPIWWNEKVTLWFELACTEAGVSWNGYDESQEQIFYTFYPHPEGKTCASIDEVLFTDSNTKCEDTLLLNGEEISGTSFDSRNYIHEWKIPYLQENCTVISRARGTVSGEGENPLIRHTTSNAMMEHGAIGAMNQGVRTNKKQEERGGSTMDLSGSRLLDGIRSLPPPLYKAASSQDHFIEEGFFCASNR
ncbi:unnamed protein product [Cyprideis torosa]|uniref:Uncharacterized protein n=1 Tax=Cyprideis torosa TaxID=163714 RepID=A0A7R8W7U9_9CRUS|nr:unnamed protein product [Cyprideis torosa]CAG0885558.1 unnamed protein product [Cyprideis torosa]